MSDKTFMILYCIVIVVVLIIGVLFIGTSIYCFINYGNLPITEVPSWTLPFMFGRK